MYYVCFCFNSISGLLGAIPTKVEFDETQVLNDDSTLSCIQLVHGVAEGRDFTFTFTFHFHALEKEMATHSSVLAWRIPGMGKPGGLLSMGSHRVGHD